MTKKKTRRKPSSTVSEAQFKFQKLPDVVMVGRKSFFTEEIQKKLKSKPKRWAQIRVYSNRDACHMLASRYRKVYPNFEFAGRKLEEGVYAVFARYVGRSSK